MNKTSKLLVLYDIMEIHSEPLSEESPERNLMAAVLEGAVREAIGWKGLPTAYPKPVKESAHRWLQSKDFHPYSFLHCCHYLDIEPDKFLNIVYGSLSRGMKLFK